MVLHPRHSSAHGIPQKRAFTLIELLIVIAIIAMLSAILFPAFTMVRDRARATSCANNLKQISMGMLQYAQDNDEKLPATFNSGGTSRGWAGRFFDYVKSPAVYVCPSDYRNRSGFTANTTIGGVTYKNYGNSYIYNMNLRGGSIAGSGTDFDGLPLARATAPTQTIAFWEMDANSGNMSYVPLQSEVENLSYTNNGTNGGSYAGTGSLPDNSSGGSNVDLRHGFGNGGNWAFLDGHVKYAMGKKISCGNLPASSSAAQHSGPGTCNGQARCAEGVTYSGAGKHLGTFSWF